MDDESIVAVDELGLGLSSLRLCRPAADEQMRRSLAHHGQLTAVVAFDSGAKLELVDGFKRVRASRQLNWTSVRVRVLAVDAAMATAVISTLHEQHGLTELEEGWIVHTLCRQHGLSQGAVAQLLRRHKSWVSRRLLLVEGLDEAVQADVRLGLLSPRAALAVAALPRGNQARAAELVMNRGMTTRQAETLVKRLRELASDTAREELIARWPDDEPATTKPRQRTPREQLLTDVAILMRVGVRVEVRLLESPADSTDSLVLRETLGDLATLLDTLSKAIRRALMLRGKVDATLAQS